MTGGSRTTPVVLAIAALALLVVARPLLGNGGTVRISRAAVGPYFVSVFSSPTPLRTGEVDISVLVQDSSDAAVDVPVWVEAAPVGGTSTGAGAAAAVIRQQATRQQATNKLFKAAKFDVENPGMWRFRVAVGEGGGAGAVGFESRVTKSTLLDQPYLLALLVLAPLLFVGWLVGRQSRTAATR